MSPLLLVPLFLRLAQFTIYSQIGSILLRNIPLLIKLLFPKMELEFVVALFVGGDLDVYPPFDGGISPFRGND